MTPLRVRPAVEPLSRQAWERVETRLFERLGRGEHLPSQNVTVRGPAPVRIWIGAAALVLAATVLLWLGLDSLHHTSPPLATAPITPLRAPEAAHAQDPSESTRIATTLAGARTTLGEATLTLAAHSEVRLMGSDERGWLVELAGGQVDCEVAPRRGRPAFTVQAGETRVSVVGTSFSVVREGAGARVSVREGHVHVVSGNAVALLGPGERWPADAPAVDTAVLDRAAPETTAGPELEREAMEPEKPSKSRSGLLGADAARARFNRAARLEASDPERAARIYADLAKTRGPWAANALYAEARLASERGHAERARTLLRRYLERYPHGANAEDVRALLDR